jgi:hypothetical protein
VISSETSEGFSKVLEDFLRIGQNKSFTELLKWKIDDEVSASVGRSP